MYGFGCLWHSEEVTRNEILRRFPAASESFIRANAVPDPVISEICQNCGSEFQCFESQHRKYCSPKCAYDSPERVKHIKKKDRGNRTCLNCGKEFSVHTGAPNARCCSRECNGAMLGKSSAGTSRPRASIHVVEISCKNCGVVFSAQRSAHRIFCSIKCARNNPEVRQRRIASFHASPRPKNYSRTQKGWSKVGGKRFFARSSWESNYARYLQFQKEHALILDWEHEPDTFWFKGIKRGVCSFLPDFKVTTKEGIEYHEVKGWMDSRSKTKIKRMAKYHPEVKLVVIDQVRYKQIAKTASAIIPGWTSQKTSRSKSRKGSAPKAKQNTLRLN